MNLRPILLLCIILTLILFSCLSQDPEESAGLNDDGLKEADGDTNGDIDGDLDIEIAEKDDDASVSNHPDGDFEPELEGQSETDGECVDCVCVPDSLRCVGAREVQRCLPDGSAWEYFATCDPGQICLDGTCQSVTDGDEDEDNGEIPAVDPCIDDNDCYEDDHYCLIDDLIQQTGYCQPYCDLEGINCPAGFHCQEGICQPVSGYCMSNEQCAELQFCDILPPNTDGICKTFCNVPGQQCPEHTVCDSDTSSLNYGKCIYNTDVQYCNFDQDCGEGRWCYLPAENLQGHCLYLCTSDADCVQGLNCNDEGHCVVGDGNGNCQGGCPSGYICDPSYNQCVPAPYPGCPACSPGYCCDQDSAPQCYPCPCIPPSNGICGFGLPSCCPPQECSVVEWYYGLIGVCI